MVAKKIARGISVMMAGQLLGNIIGLVSTLVMAALLIPEDFGVFALATSFVTIISAMFDLQTSSVLIQMPDPKKQDFDTVFTLNLLRGVILCLGVCALAWPISAYVGDERLFPLLLLLSLQPLLLSLRNPYFERYAKDLSFGPTTLLDLAAKILSFVGAVGYAVINPSYWALACGVLISAFAGTLMTYLVRREFPGLSLGSFRYVFSFSIWLGFSALLEQMRNVSGRLILGIAANATTLGFFALALQIVEQIMAALMRPFNWAMFSGFSQFTGDPERLKSTYNQAHTAMASLLIPAATGMLLVSEPIISTFFGAKWENTVLFLQFCASVYILNGIAGPVWALGMSMGRTRLLFLRTALSLTLAVVCQLVGIYYYGVLGFLIGGFIAAAANCAISLQITRQLIGLSYVKQLRNIVRPFCASLVMVPMVLLTQTALLATAPTWLVLGLSILVGVATYASTILLMWAMAGYPAGPERLALNTFHSVRERAGALLR